MKKICLLLTMLISLVKITFALDMNTTLFDQRIDTGGYREIIFKNNSTQKVRYKFFVKEGDTKKDMSKWVKLYPKVMTIPPLQEKTLKLYAQSPKDAEKGEYSFNLQVAPVVVPTISKDNGKISGSMNIAISPIIAMSGYVGDPEFEKNLSLKDIKFKKIENSKEKEIEVTATIENKSNVSLNVGLKFLNSAGLMVDGSWIGRINDKATFKAIIKRFNKPEDVKKIVIYDATNIVELKTITL